MADLLIGSCIGDDRGIIGPLTVNGTATVVVDDRIDHPSGVKKRAECSVKQGRAVGLIDQAAVAADKGSKR